jgi:uncharacterized protein YecE (DUF72 family)
MLAETKGRVMSIGDKFIVGTSGYSFKDWVGPFYPPGTRGPEMLTEYVKHFETVELNFTYYRMPTMRTLSAIADRTPPEFTFWVKANQETTHKHNRSVADPFIDSLAPLGDAGKLSGVLLQFPQSFHRTEDNRRYLAAALDDFASLPLAVEFRHRSWATAETNAGLRDRGAALVIPDAPDIPALYHHDAAATSSIGYLRLHSRNADKWYAGGEERYDYGYDGDELEDLLRKWQPIAELTEKVFVYFNNCHASQAAENAESFRRLLGQIP